MPLSAVVGICLQLAGAPEAVPRYVPTQRFTLAWEHSIEKVRWEEDYLLVPASSAEDSADITLVEARVKGSAAGMEPPEDAYLKDGWYHYTPASLLVQELRLTRSGYTADYDLCIDQQCQRLEHYLETDGGITLLRACMPPATADRVPSQ
ncbi:DUF1850 domain-containing protein [Alcaligenaceae bacterium 429]|nr:DUF1850 domain-containing protein [Alcaligenaceae bacterium 429]